MTTENLLHYKVITPAGRCPFQLEGTDADSVKKWMKKIKRKIPAGVEFMPEAYRYWIRHTYDINGPEFKEAAESLAEIFKPGR